HAKAGPSTQSMGEYAGVKRARGGHGGEGWWGGGECWVVAAEPGTAARSAQLHGEGVAQRARALQDVEVGARPRHRQRASAETDDPLVGVGDVDEVARCGREKFVLTGDRHEGQQDGARG